MKCCVDVTRQCAGTNCMGFVLTKVMEEKKVPYDEVEAHHADGWRDRQEECDGCVIMTKFFEGGKCGLIYSNSK